MNRVFRRRKFNFVNKFKGDFEAKSWKYFRNFERDERIRKAKRQDWDKDKVLNTAFRLII